MQNKLVRSLLILCCLAGDFVLASGTMSAATEQELEAQIERMIGIFSDDVVTEKDHQFTLSVPKEIIPLLIRRLERERRVVNHYSVAFGLLDNKLQQFKDEVSDEVRRQAIGLMVETCEAATNEVALIYLNELRLFKDPSFIGLARRMKNRPDANIQKAALRVIDPTDTKPVPLRPPG